MSAWTDAITDERKATAKRFYERLQKIGWNDLDDHDRTVMLLLGWFCLEVDDSGEPDQLIHADLEIAQ